MDELFFGVTVNGQVYEVWGDGLQDAVCDACRFYLEDNPGRVVATISAEVY